MYQCPGNVQSFILCVSKQPIMGKYFLSAIPGGGSRGTVKLNEELMKTCGDLCEFEHMANPDKRKIEIASANGVATARAVAKVFGILANGGKHDNKTLLSKAIINEYVNDKRGPTPDLVMFDHPVRWKYGMDVIPHDETPGNLFGAPGAGGQVGYADPNIKVGYGFVTRYMSPMAIQIMDPRFKHLQASVENAVKKMKRK